MHSLKFVLPCALVLCAILCRAENTPYTCVYAFVESPESALFVSDDGGVTWEKRDKSQWMVWRPFYFANLIVDPKNPKNVWVGTGESWTRNSVSIGDGIYKSTDGGETWTHAGLEKSERIAKVVVSPKDSDTVFACVPGALWSDSPDRGLYKTTDGGKTWKQVLKGPNLSTGCTAIAIDPTNPDVMLASTWDLRLRVCRIA